MGMIEINETNYQEKVIGSDKPFLLDFSASWCGPCRQLKPILEELSNELDGQAVIGHLDVDACQTLAEKHAVTAVPTMVLFKNGEVAEKMQGLLPKGAIKSKIEAALS